MIGFIFWLDAIHRIEHGDMHEGLGTETKIGPNRWHLTGRLDRFDGDITALIRTGDELLVEPELGRVTILSRPAAG